MPRNEQDEENQGEMIEIEEDDESTAADRSGSCCRSMALIVSVVLRVYCIRNINNMRIL